MGSCWACPSEGSKHIKNNHKGLKNDGGMGRYTVDLTNRKVIIHMFLGKRYFPMDNYFLAIILLALHRGRFRCFCPKIPPRFLQFGGRSISCHPHAPECNKNGSACPCISIFRAAWGRQNHLCQNSGQSHQLQQPWRRWRTV